MLYKIAYYVDYERFRQEALPLAALADAGNHEAVCRRAREIASAIPRGRWILEGRGASLSQVDVAWSNPAESTGFCFLVVLSQYLCKVQVPLLMDYVWAGLQSLGWSQDQLVQAFRGMDMVTLLKPEWGDEGAGQGPAAYPYYVRPAHTLYASWQSWNQIESAWQLLKTARPGFLQLDFTKYQVPFPVDSLADVVPVGYDRLIRIYAKAVRTKVGMLEIRGV